MQPALANPELTPKPKLARWRCAALVAASTVALAACGASAAGGAMPSPNAPAAISGPGATANTAPTPAATADVGIVNFKFNAAALTVKAGTTVVWTNRDTIAHSVNFATGGINSKVLNQNDQFTYTFKMPGTYDYICALHPFMHGSVTVTA